LSILDDGKPPPGSVEPGSGVLTMYSCRSNPDGDSDVVGAQKCRCMMKTCSLAHWRQSYVCALKAEKAAPHVLGCGSTQIS